MKRAATEWTTPADIRAQALKLWNRGALLSAMVTGEPLFPLRLLLKGPNSRQFSERFAEVQEWIAQLTTAAGPYRIAWRTVNHRILGSNEIPSELWIDSMDDALALIGKRRDVETFAGVIELTRQREPALLYWLARRPLRALELAEAWPLLLRLVEWLRNHPRPGIYLRQIDLPGVHTKFIEAHRGTLSELFDLALPPELIDAEATGIASFCQRYGFRDKPLRVRFRLLDPALTLLSGGVDQDVTVTQADFARLDLPVDTVFITENEINFLAFPSVSRAMVIFGAGYGFRNLTGIDWFRSRELRYWGDIDTHGLAILNQFREHFPHAISLLMDRETLLAHREHWETEPHPETAELTRLTEAEQSLYDDLRENRLGESVRLEQEKIGYEMLVEALRKV